MIFGSQITIWVVVALAAGEPAPGSGRPTSLDGFQVVRIAIDNSAALETLHSWEVDPVQFQIWSDGVSASGTIDARVSPQYLRALREHRFPYEVLIPDVQRDMDERFTTSVAGEDFFSGYQTNDEHAAFLQDLATQFPQWATVSQIGQSVEGRTITMIHIKVGSDPRPAVMYIGAQHGNEATNPAILAYLSEYLLNQYGEDEQVTGLLDELEFFIVPIVNPDGYAASDRYNAHGVDLNRDWAAPGATTPFSEPETSAVRDVMLANPHIQGFIDFHTFGYMILWPYGYTPQLPEDHFTFKTLADEMAAVIFEVRGTDYWRRGATYETLYPAVGTSKDYAYDARNTWGFTLEVGGSYAVSVSNLMPTILDIVPAAVYFAEWIVDCDGDGVSNADELAAGATDCNSNGTVDTCESNHDGDELIDTCDTDDDNDGVSDVVDDCPRAMPGVPSAPTGQPLADVDNNCRIDANDFGFYFDDLVCLDDSGPGTASPTARCRTFIDFDQDQDVDMRDVAVFFNSFDAPNP